MCVCVCVCVCACVVLSLVMSPPSQSIAVLAGRRVAAPAISSATNLSAGCRRISPFAIIAYGNGQVQGVCACVHVCARTCVCVCTCRHVDMQECTCTATEDSMQKPILVT